MKAKKDNLRRNVQVCLAIYCIKRARELSLKNITYKNLLIAVVFLIAAYFFGGGIAVLVQAAGKNVTKEEANWGLGFHTEGQPPTGNATTDELKKYDTYFIGDTDKKVIYLTFDAGYENGNTPAILAALKKHNVHATFFIVGNYIKTCPELVKQMVAEGHRVANHTYNHPNMSKLSSKEAFQKEITSLETEYETVTGQKMTKYYRPPQGKYSTKNLEMAKEMGYTTFFWSLAYVDWYQDKQPTKEEAFKKLLGRIHPGAIVLLHSTSKTNGDILDELLTKWEEMGYTFGTLDDIAKTGEE